MPSCDVAWVDCGGCSEGLNQGYSEEKHFPGSVECPHCMGDWELLQVLLWRPHPGIGTEQACLCGPCSAMAWEGPL